MLGLDSVAVLRPAEGSWELEYAVGGPAPHTPQDAQFAMELADPRVLAIMGSRLQDQDAELLTALLTSARQTRERAQAQSLSSP